MFYNLFRKKFFHPHSSEEIFSIDSQEISDKLKLYELANKLLVGRFTIGVKVLNEVFAKDVWVDMQSAGVASQRPLLQKQFVECKSQERMEYSYFNGFSFHILNKQLRQRFES